jgi:ubiquinone/menaquinone biosynthesis C-methylase UbiE
MREGNIANYTEAYQYRKVPASFLSPKDDAPVISSTFSSLASIEKPKSLNALVLGVGGPKAARRIAEIFWEDISRGNSEDTLTMVDIRDFLERDYDAVGEDYLDRTFLLQEDARDLSFDDESFNLVLTHCFFPCLRDEDLYEVLEEINRVTVDNGLGIHTFRSTSLLGRGVRRVWSALDMKKTGCKYYDRSDGKMEELLNSNGFEIKKMMSMRRSIEDCINLTLGCIKKERHMIKKYSGSRYLLK